MTGLGNAEKLRKDFWDTINNKNKVSINLLTDNDIEICLAELSAETGRETITAAAVRCSRCSGISRKKLQI